LNTPKTKRWNGKIESLTAEYLNSVMEQMLTYGDRVEFSLNAGGQRPHYQVINTAEKKMAFDSSHLLAPAAEGFPGSTTSRIFTLEQIEAAMTGVGTKGVGARLTRVGSTRTTAAQKTALIDAERYEYFKNNRPSLPANIGKHTREITVLMLNGLSAEDAFAEIIKRHP
jgi:hypothetical protein